ncbi:DNA alkylation repair protein [Streptomyces sp. V2I9]|uniref:DNA alkylation repair protein n=1 Tax=Streptomyces sp. V2I9 TaxID=3042304 RepID=UPI0027849F3B|nr:DNA alkylation repair protein [Streptomyces sp. V2I9]MDQ0983070.1 3-methyladenine DNA glycosylase AlkD [Streptomyces sp. V2I9]
MAAQPQAEATVAEVMAELAELEDPRARAVNERHVAWSADPDPVVASAGWALTTERVGKRPEGLDLPGLLDVIEAGMKDAPDRLQWAMNHCLARIGIDHPALRARAVGIGERLEVLKDHPTSAGCTSPYAPDWIAEMVRRQDAR